MIGLRITSRVKQQRSSQKVMLVLSSIIFREKLTTLFSTRLLFLVELR